MVLQGCIVPDVARAATGSQCVSRGADDMAVFDATPSPLWIQRG